MRRSRAERSVAGQTSTAVGVIVAVCLAGACAARRPASLSDRLVRPASAADLEASAGATFDVPSPAATAPAAPVPAGPPAAVPDIVARTFSTGSLEDADESLASALAALGREPTPEALVLAADEYRRLRVYDRAESYLSAALARRPGDPLVHDRLARLWRDWGFPALAWPHAVRAEFHAPDSAVVQNTMATILFAMGQVAEAAARLERAIAFDPGAAWAHSNLCFVRASLGDATTAVGHCEAALRLQPDLQAARANLAMATAAVARTSGDRRNR